MEANRVADWIKSFVPESGIEFWDVDRQVLFPLRDASAYSVSTEAVCVMIKRRDDGDVYKFTVKLHPVFHNFDQMVKKIMAAYTLFRMQLIQGTATAISGDGGDFGNGNAEDKLIDEAYGEAQF